MGLFKRFVGSRIEATPLQQFVECISPKSIIQSTEAVENASMRAATAVSLSVLMTACRFQRSLTKMIDEARNATSAPMIPTPHDVVVFEAAAYCHYQLLADNLAMRDGDDADWDEDVEDDDDKADATVTAMKDSVHLTETLLRGQTSFGLPAEFFGNRVISYSLKPQSALDNFESLVNRGVALGEPSRSVSDKLSLDLAVTLGLKGQVRIFQTTLVPGLLETCARLCAHYTA